MGGKFFSQFLTQVCHAVKLVNLMRKYPFENLTGAVGFDSVFLQPSSQLFLAQIFDVRLCGCTHAGFHILAFHEK